MISKLDSKVALVTGGNSGIGRAAALAFAREGAKVVIAARRVPEGQETVHLINEVGGEAIFVPTDVSRAIEVEAMVNKTVEAYGRLDYAFNNAGTVKRVSLVEMTEEDFDRVISVNLKGVWLCMKYEIPQMLNQGGGTIVNMSSGYGVAGSARGVSAYAASKHGVIGLSRTAALEYAKAGIRVNSVVPGWIRTPMLESGLSRDPQLEARILEQGPLGRMGTSAEIAEAVVWLCSDASSFVTGHNMVIDGGVHSSWGL